MVFFLKLGFQIAENKRISTLLNFKDTKHRLSLNVV